MYRVVKVYLCLINLYAEDLKTQILFGGFAAENLCDNLENQNGKIIFTVRYCTWYHFFFLFFLGRLISGGLALAGGLAAECHIRENYYFFLITVASPFTFVSITCDQREIPRISQHPSPLFQTPARPLIATFPSAPHLQPCRAVVAAATARMPAPWGPRT